MVLALVVRVPMPMLFYSSPSSNYSSHGWHLSNHATSIYVTEKPCSVQNIFPKSIYSISCALRDSKLNLDHKL